MSPPELTEVSDRLRARRELRARRDRSTSILRNTLQFERVNLEIARAVLRDVERYGGPGAGLVLWAKLVAEKADHFQLEACR